jgi:hypothetical protein
MYPLKQVGVGLAKIVYQVHRISRAVLCCCIVERGVVLFQQFTNIVLVIFKSNHLDNYIFFVNVEFHAVPSRVHVMEFYFG